MRKFGPEELLADFLVIFSVGTIVLAAVSYVSSDIWLASSQWLAVASLTMLYAIYIQLKK